MQSFPTVKEMRASRYLSGGQEFDSWLAVAKFRRSSLRDRVNLALLREAVEAMSALECPVHIMDFIIGTDLIGLLVCVDPGVDLELIEDLVNTIDKEGTLSNEAMSAAIEPEVIKRWKAGTLFERMHWISRARLGADSVLQTDPPNEVFDDIERLIE